MRKGISLVALVITIIVLIILTAAVVLTGGDAPDQAKKAVFFNDVANVQDAVQLKMVANIAAMNDPTIAAADKPVHVLDGIIDFDGETALADVEETGTINPDDEDIDVYAIAATPEQLSLSISATELAKYVVDANGTVYYWNDGDGQTLSGKAYYSRDVEVKD